MALALRFVPLMENDLEPAVHLLTIKETAELLPISTQTVYRMAQTKELPAIKVGSLWRFRESELAKWIQGLNKL
jgi:excisionase family DNA binding protein